MPSQKRLDFKAAQKVELFIANSTTVQARIKKYYHQNSIIIHPPVETKRFTPARERSDFYVALGRQLPYKRVDLAVAAATKLGAKLKVFGNGPEHDKLLNLAGPTIEFHTDRYGDASDEAVTGALNKAKGFLFPAEEDFGIVQAEALAAGAPVIAYNKGGAMDIVDDGESGVLFDSQTVDSLVKAIQKAEQIKFMPSLLNRRAKRFDKGLFITKIRKVVSDAYTKTSYK
jgi:glycosyltransferase involved in cell wall biosynthesis